MKKRSVQDWRIDERCTQQIRPPDSLNAAQIRLMQDDPSIALRRREVEQDVAAGIRAGWDAVVRVANIQFGEMDMDACGPNVAKL